MASPDGMERTTPGGGVGFSGHVTKHGSRKRNPPNDVLLRRRSIVITGNENISAMGGKESRPSFITYEEAVKNGKSHSRPEN